MEQAFRKYLECGIVAHGFARARCDDCGHDFFVAFSCKGRGVCPSCNTRRMAETAAHLADLPRLAVRQWVLSVPKRLRYFLQRDGVALNTALRIFLRVIQGSLHQHCPGAARVDKAARVIRAGGLVGFPTETVYGLGARMRRVTAPWPAFLPPRAGRPTIR